jgi:hypothetical protein
MRFVPSLPVILLCSALAVPVLAQAPPQSKSTQTGTAPKGTRLKVDRFIAELDKNKDGCISHDEWVGAGLEEFNFKMLEQQAAKRDCVTETELLKGPSPEGMDTNGDGYLTVAKMLAYSKAHPMPAGGPDGPAPANAAPQK